MMGYPFRTGSQSPRRTADTSEPHSAKHCGAPGVRPDSNGAVTPEFSDALHQHSALSGLTAQDRWGLKDAPRCSVPGGGW